MVGYSNEVDRARVSRDGCGLYTLVEVGDPASLVTAVSVR
jgi:hypothetical protein